MRQGRARPPPADVLPMLPFAEPSERDEGEADSLLPLAQHLKAQPRRKGMALQEVQRLPAAKAWPAAKGFTDTNTEISIATSIKEVAVAAAAQANQYYAVKATVAKPEDRGCDIVALLDDGAMGSVMSLSWYSQHEQVLGPLEKTWRVVTIADGKQQDVAGMLELLVRVGHTTVLQEVYVIDASREYNLLLGKPWHFAVDAIHFHLGDWLFASGEGGFGYIPNHRNHTQAPSLWGPEEALAAVQDIAGDTLLPSSVFIQSLDLAEEQLDSYGEATLWEFSEPIRCFQTKIMDASRKVDPNKPVDKEWHNTYQPFRIGPPRERDPRRGETVLKHVQIGVWEDDKCLNLSPQQLETLQTIVLENKDVFGLDASDTWQNQVCRHSIKLKPDAKPSCPHCSTNRIAPGDREWVHKELDRMLAAGFVKKVDSSNVTWVTDWKVVPKGKGPPPASIEESRRRANDALKEAGLPFDKELPPAPPFKEVFHKQKRWLVFTFTALNKAMEDTSFPTGTLDERLQRLAGMDVYSLFDGMSGYFAILNDEATTNLLVFEVEGRGHFAWQVMPFGTKLAPGRYQDFVSRIFPVSEFPETVVWMDNIAAAHDGNNWFANHCTFLHRFFRRCRLVGFALAAQKCQIGVSNVIWCGNKVSKLGIESDPAKVDTIVRWPTPTTPMDVPRFTAMASFLRTRLPALSNLVSPLLECIRGAQISPKDKVPRTLNARNELARPANKRGAWRRALEASPLLWEKPQQQAFALVKAAIANAVANAKPNPKLPWIIETDGSPSGLGAGLFQRQVIDGTTKTVLISLASRNCTPLESKSSQFLLELMAICFALDKFDLYIKYRPSITFVTDCLALRNMLQSDTLLSTHLRWRESLLGYPILRFVHRPGLDNTLCDALAHRPGVQQIPLEASSLSREYANFDVAVEDALWGETPRNNGQEGFKAASGAGEGPRGRTLGAGTPTDTPDSVPRKGLAVILFDKTPTGLNFIHVDHSVANLLERFKGDELEDMVWFLATLHLLERADTSRRAVICRLVRRMFLRDGEMWRLSGKEETPLSEVSIGQVLVAVDYFSRFVWVWPCCQATGTRVVAALRDLASRWRVPRRIVTNNGSHFDNGAVEQACNKMNIRHSKTPAYALWVNGLVERNNGILITALKKRCSEYSIHVHKWPSVLADAISIINSRPLPSLGYTPAELMFGVVATVEQDETSPEKSPSKDDILVRFALIDGMRDSATMRHLLVQHRACKKGPPSVGPFFDVGTLVMAKLPPLHNKLAEQWAGPFKVVESNEFGRSAKLESLGGAGVRERFHFRRLKKYQVAEDANAALRLAAGNPTEEHEAEQED
ncbi:FOG: Transposon-encoded proteins with TYA, reverse transcriptase, integrase domains in various combinations [Ceraceosorus bombacis]|uniref:FOG: Transposon-encoded proteins with TYA, reverse transcriptase, integrase domains in various combinations n=1 Tax=Ceraceosorus bombacis TaxID=401625 RepID=A0A0P1BN90_9BASI|nr:FOG: Transposon-encoded proteins with TYA, reverse transcriptase, integrase domains in various combinations [Ceraceosorus bombacis]